MAAEQIDVAVVGVGYIGELHARLYHEHRSTNLRAVIDIEEERASEVANLYNVPHAVTDIETALTEHDLDAVTVATPETHHREPTETLLEHDIFVLLEKPIADTVADARAIGEAVEESEAELLLGYCCRFHPQYAALKDRIDTGDIGDLRSISAARVASREVYDMVAGWTHPMYYLAVHDIDMMRWYAGVDVTSLSASASAGFGEYEVPAVVTTTMRFEDGTVGLLETNWGRSEAYPSIRTDEIRVTGTNGHGRLIIENNDATVTTDGEFDYLDTSELHDRETGMYRFQLDHFVDVIHDDGQPIATWQDGLESLKVANAVIESIDTDGRIQVAPE